MFQYKVKVWDSFNQQISNFKVENIEELHQKIDEIKLKW